MRDADLLEAAVREAGAAALALFKSPVEKWRKSDSSPVSAADLAVNRILEERLMSARPGYGWLSEESADGPARLAASFCWVVDPIDGTRSFLKGSDQWCVAAALVRDGRPIAAAVYRPAAREFYRAETGGGARLNGRVISVSGHRAIAGARLHAPRGLITRLAGAVRPEDGVPLLLGLCHVARGAADGMAAEGAKHDWDVCAGDLIVGEAGGVVTDLSGAAPVYNRAQTFQRGIVAAGRGLHGALLRAVT